MHIAHFQAQRLVCLFVTLIDNKLITYVYKIFIIINLQIIRSMNLIFTSTITQKL